VKVLALKSLETVKVEAVIAVELTKANYIVVSLEAADYKD